MADSDNQAGTDGVRISAEPTKDFFISMLVRDIELIPAITDLVDNSLDGARRIRGQKSYDGLWVRVNVAEDRFSIEDNCGGIDAETAQTYAFRFGRPSKAKAVKHSIGQFGVGMKRALFKIGSKFKVTSTAQRSKFSMSVDVPSWRQRKDWNFVFDELTEYPKKEFAEAKRGTAIEVTELHEGVSADFGSGQFLADLRADLERKHQLSVARGMEIEVNDKPLAPRAVHFAVSREIKPDRKRFRSKGVRIGMSAGIAESDGSAGGWYVFCNGRLILAADQTKVTGWGWKRGDASTPKFHNQYARFRGYVFFDADDASRLPWNTTKTSVDLDSTVFRQARREILAMTRPVIDFLNDLATEIAATRNGDAGPLEMAVKKAEENLCPLDKTSYGKGFVRPSAVPIESGPKTSAIHYDRPVKQIERLKELLGVSTNYEVGEFTFDDFYREAIGDPDDE